MKPWAMRVIVTCLCVPCASSEAAVAEAPERSPGCRTRFTFRRPTRVNALSILFDGDGGHQQDIVSFNHDEVGLTQPTPSNGAFPLCRGYPSKWSKRNREFLEQLERTNDNGDDATICSRADVDGWRVLRFQKRVGHGEQCYKRVRNAVFDWDFDVQKGQKSLGIVSVAPTKSAGPSVLDARLDAKASGYTPPRRGLLATFSEIWLPNPLRSVFVVNPVHTVYDVKDERCIPKCVMSASAYATCKGHLLVGEERVAVIWRKGMGGEVDVEIISFSRAAPSVAGKLIWPLIGRMQKQFFLSEMDHLDKVAKARM